MSAAYLLFLLFSLGSMVLCDWRWKLNFFRAPRRSAVILLALLAMLLCWDALGIATGTFYRGDSPYMLGIELAPEMPVEEPIFLCFLVYLTMNIAGWVQR
ncbi:lycopene cyclase domain-containing protein [Corynebacterium gerontici]|uniref:Lycopene cyclase domain-containing protein n=1 Tax=Corynebacterium gerontici TaxID=2079234 RepID=A0A3G6J0P4_9CORY|nr:lycopene cyclase domain-containing protein [Corynebacterium gerontici]AZA10528.1 hypothetical protein CGERO_00965 [Corynebacterium gerontici]